MQSFRFILERLTPPIKNNKMQISQNGIDLIKFFEGCPMEDGMVVSYRCAANKPTIGFGSLKLIDGSPVQDGMTITPQEAEDLLAHELKEYEEYINDMVNVELNQNQFDSLVSWVFNLGPTNLKNSSLLKILNSTHVDWADIPYQIQRWNKVNGVPNEGLKKRRKAEALLFEGQEWGKV